MASTGEVACLGDDFNEAFLRVISLLVLEYRKELCYQTGTLKEKAELLDD